MTNKVELIMAKWLDRWFPQRWFVGLLTFKVYGTRWWKWGPPWAADWEGSIGPFPAKETAEQAAHEMTQLASLEVARLGDGLGGR